MHKQQHNIMTSVRGTKASIADRAVQSTASFVTISSPLLSARQLQSTALNWNATACTGLNASFPIDCAVLQVPLDYTNSSSNATLPLQLLRVPAPQSPSRGAILTNFGGPGYEARNTLLLFAEQMQNATGGEFDLIAFDPRGTGVTMPFALSENPVEVALLQARYPLQAPDDSDTGLGRLWAQAGAISSSYNQSEFARARGELQGTAFVARDLMSVVDALGNGSSTLLNYWGVSYGTLLGATVAAMFPDRMGSVVLDATINVNRYYYHSGVDIDQFRRSDDVWRRWLAACIEAGTSKCAIADLAPDAAELEKVVANATDSYRTSPISVTAAGPNGTSTVSIIDYTAVNTFAFLFARSGQSLATLPLTDLLRAVVQRNETGLGRVVTLLNALQDDPVGGALPGIKCSDQFPRYSNVDELKPDLDYMMESSKNFGTIGASLAAVCSRWPFVAKERYEGGFLKPIETKNPLLILHNSYDGVTTVASAYNTSSSFVGSRVVEQEGFGHGTLAQASSCSMNALRNYFVNGTLPEDNIKCPVDVPLFV